MRWLLVKDLRILKRSPLLVTLLVLYPLVVALLVGVALSSGPSKPKVAFANLVPSGEAEIDLGGQQLDATTYAARLFENVDPIRVDTREEAIAKVESGEALGALVIPPDVISRLQNRLSLGGGPPPTVEVYFSAENPLKRRYVESTIAATLSDANKALSDEIFKEAAGYLNLIVAGGTIDLPVVGDVDILGLRNARTIIDGALAQMPADDPSRRPLEEVSRFAELAAENLDVSKPILESIATPVAVDERALGGTDSSLDVFGVEVAVVLSLMVVTLLLAAGMLALEREEHAFGRLVRGLVSRTTLLVEKIGLAALCGGALAVIMLACSRGLPRSRVGPRPGLGARARGLGRGLRGARRRDRGADARGARRVAARVHARAAGGGARADPVRGGERRPLRRHPDRLWRLSVQARALGARRGVVRRRDARPAAPPRGPDARVRRAGSRRAPAFHVKRSPVERFT